MAKETKQTPETKSGKKKPNWFKRAWTGLNRWFREMKSELKKVVWPTKKQVVNNTIVALVVMIVSAIVIWGFDEIAQMIVKAVISVAG